MNKQVILGFFRHLLTYGGGALTAKGITTASEAELIVGGVVAAAGVLWSWFEKRSRVQG